MVPIHSFFPWAQCFVWITVLGWLGIWNGCDTKKESSYSFHVYSTIDTSTKKIGDILHYQVWAKGAGQRIIQFPELVIDNPDISVGEGKAIKGSYLDDHGMEFEIVFWDTGVFAIPAYSVTVLSTMGDSAEYSMSTDSISVTVQSVIEDSQPFLRDIKGPVPLPMILPLRIIFLCCSILFLLVILVWLWRKRIPGKKEKPKIYIPSRPPYEIAMEKLERLRNFDISKLSSIKEFYVELSYITREYLEYQFFVRAIEMTTEEIIDSKSYLPLGKDYVDPLLDVLKRADLAKFARFQLDRDQCLNDLDVVEHFITESRIGWLPVNLNRSEWRIYD